MLWKIIVIVAAFFLFRRARRRRPALTCLKLWGKTLYRRHKPVEAELLRVEERNGTNLLVCDVPSLQKHALISVDRKRAQQFRRYLASLEAKNGEEARSGIRLEQYKVDGDTFLLTVQNELKQAAYLPSAQREREAQCCFSKRMRKVFRKNEKSMLQNCNKKAKRKGRLQRVKKPM